MFEGAVTLLGVAEYCEKYTNADKFDKKTVTEEGCCNLPQLIGVLAPTTQGLQTCGQVIFTLVWTLVEESSDLSTRYSHATVTRNNLLFFCHMASMCIPMETFYHVVEMVLVDISPIPQLATLRLVILMTKSVIGRI